MSVQAEGQQPEWLRQLIAEQQAGQYGATSTSTSGIYGQVYWGQEYREVRSGPEGIAPKRTYYAPRYISPDEALQEFDRWDEKKINDFVAQARVGGLLSPGDGELQARGLWAKLVESSAAKGAVGNNVSPFDILAGYVKNAGSSGVWIDQGNGFQRNAVTGETRYVGPRFQTTTQTSTDLTDPQTARALTTSIFQQLLGRDPMPGELQSYADALASAEQANPVVTRTTVERDAEGNVVGQSSESTGGLGQGGSQYLLANRVKSGKEYGATQAATTYMNAFERAVWGSPG